MRSVGAFQIVGRAIHRPGQYPRHHNNYMQLFLFSGINSLMIAITITVFNLLPNWFSRNATVLGKTLWLQLHLWILKGIILQKLHLELHFKSVGNLNCNHFGADSTLGPAQTYKIWRVPNPPGASPLVAESAPGRSSQSCVTGGQQPMGNPYRLLCHFFCTPGNPCATPIVTRGVTCLCGRFGYFFVFFCSGRRRGGPRRRGGCSPGLEGLRGREGVCRELRNFLWFFFFFSGPKCPPRLRLLFLPRWFCQRSPAFWTQKLGKSRRISAKIG